MIRRFHHGAAVFDVVGAVHRVDDRHHRRRAAPQRHQKADAQQARIVAVRKARQLILQKPDDGGRRDRREQPHQLVGEAVERKEAGQGDEEQQRREERQEEIVGKLCGDARRIVLNGILDGPPRQLLPAQLFFEIEKHAPEGSKRRSYERTVESCVSSMTVLRPASRACASARSAEAMSSISCHAPSRSGVAVATPIVRSR